MDHDRPNFDPQPVLDLINSIQTDLDRLKGFIQPPPPELDPMDSRNKMPDGKLTPRGVAVCYRLFEEGWTRYAVAKAMNISFGAASHRLSAWKAELIKLALQPGPKQYLAFNKLARRMREEPASWSPPKRPWFWDRLDCTRAPNAIEMEWALLQCSQQFIEGKDPELDNEQQARIDELEHELDQIPDSLATKCYNAIAAELRAAGSSTKLGQE